MHQNTKLRSAVGKQIIRGLLKKIDGLEMEKRASDKEIHDLNIQMVETETKTSSWESQFAREFKVDMKRSFFELNSLTKAFSTF